MLGITAVTKFCIARAHSSISNDRVSNNMELPVHIRMIHYLLGFKAFAALDLVLYVEVWASALLFSPLALILSLALLAAADTLSCALSGYLRDNSDKWLKTANGARCLGHAHCIRGVE